MRRQHGSFDDSPGAGLSSEGASAVQPAFWRPEQVMAQPAGRRALVCSVLRRQGRPIPTNDRWIAASALERGAALLTRDAHFGQVEGLCCGQQLEDFRP